MPEKWTLARSFAHFGAAGANQRWSWSARSEDGTTVVMTLWKDLLDYSGQLISYSTFGAKNLPEWMDQPGNRERVENLKWARDRCDGIFRVVIITAADVNAYPRKIATCFPQDRLLMRITDLNEDTGEFSAINVGK